jgi:tRNA A37 threonylcarbamoyladenosine synthetase subunit TsaC/SUA5/YrdC
LDAGKPVRGRILEGEEVADFVWARAGNVKNYAAWCVLVSLLWIGATTWVIVGSAELPRVWRGKGKKPLAMRC